MVVAADRSESSPIHVAGPLHVVGVVVRRGQGPVSCSVAMQLHEVLEGAEQADLAIALMHHPWDYLADFDAAEAREAIHRRCDVLLRGHLHGGEGAARVRPDGGSLDRGRRFWGGTSTCTAISDRAEPRAAKRGCTSARGMATTGSPTAMLSWRRARLVARFPLRAR